MKKSICLMMVLSVLCLSVFSAFSIASADSFSPSISYSGTTVSTGSYSTGARAKHYSHIQISLSVTYMKYNVQNHSGIYTNGHSPYTSSNNPNQATSSIKAVVRANNAKDTRMGANATGRRWWTPVTD